jgi:hypothetical protein
MTPNLMSWTIELNLQHPLIQLCKNSKPRVKLGIALKMIVVLSCKFWVEYINLMITKGRNSGDKKVLGMGLDVTYLVTESIMGHCGQYTKI